jgi:hypothetical protein
MMHEFGFLPKTKGIQENIRFQVHLFHNLLALYFLEIVDLPPTAILPTVGTFFEIS